MNFTEMGRITKAGIVSLAMMLGLSACTRDYTVAYVYVTTAKSNPGVINQYAVDYSAGSLTSIGSPIAAGNDPISLVASPSGLFVYVINHLDTAKPVQEFAVQSDGSLTLKNSYTIPGSNPSAVAIDPAGKFLYVTYTYQAGYSTATPGPGGVAIFPVNADNSLGTVSSVNVGNNPVGITVSYFNHFVYVVDEADATVLGFSQNASTGALTTLPGTTITTVAGKTVATGYGAGVVPSAIAEEQTARFVYVTDQASNQLIGYVVQSNGSLFAMQNGPFSTGLYPVAVTVDPRGKLLYVANFNANSIEGYAIDTATGTPSSAGTGAYQQPTGTGPSCVAIDPALGVYLFTADNLDNTTTAERLNPSTGSLAPVQNSPFPTAGSPTCVTVVANGSHATQVIVP
jgi:6-phosphogluconolactonase (cycloisomerase 2 family)